MPSRSPASRSRPPRAPRTGSPASWTSRAKRLLPVLVGLLAPALLALVYVHRFAVDVPVYDEWNFMPTVETFYSGGDWWSEVVEHYGEHRIVLPRLVILYLSTITDLDLRVQQYLSVLFMLGTAAICWRLLRRTGGPVWAIVPIGWLVLSTAQYENLLVGWQFQIPMMNLFAAAAVYRLAGERPWRGVGAAACGVGATFSFANGMAIWPAGLIGVAAGRPGTRCRTAVIWIGTAVTAAIVYRWGYRGFDRPPDGYLHAVFNHPWNALRMYVALAGNSFGEGRLPVMLAAGVVVLGLSVAGFVLLAHRRGWNRLDLPWLALWSFSAASILAVTLGRSFAWERLVTPSRFLTVAVFVPVALTVVLARVGRDAWERPGPRLRARRALLAGMAVLLLVVAVRQEWRTVRLGWRTGVAHRNLKQGAIPCLLRYRTAPTECLQGLYVADGELVRKRAATLERWRLGVFSERAALALVTADAAGATAYDGMEGTFEFVGIRGPSGETNVAARGETVVAEGWALTEELSGPGAVILTVDGRWVAATAAFARRRDVDRFFGRPTPPSAFRIELDTVDLAPGEHRLRALAVPPGASAPLPIPGEQVLVVRSVDAGAVEEPRAAAAGSR